MRLKCCGIIKKAKSNDLAFFLIFVIFEILVGGASFELATPAV
jgi:hypothetical protein